MRPSSILGRALRFCLPRTFGRLGIVPSPSYTQPPYSNGSAVHCDQATPAQPYATVAGVPLPSNVGPHSSRFTPLPIQSNTINLASASGITTNVPGSFAGTSNAPGMQFSGSFLDNIQLDFLIRATEADRRSTVLTAPRVTLRNTQQAQVVVATMTTYVANVSPVVAQNVATGGAALGVIPSGSILWVQAAVSSDLKYVTMTLAAVHPAAGRAWSRLHP